MRSPHRSKSVDAEQLQVLQRIQREGFLDTEAEMVMRKFLVGTTHAEARRENSKHGSLAEVIRVRMATTPQEGNGYVLSQALYDWVKADEARAITLFNRILAENGN